MMHRSRSGSRIVFKHFVRSLSHSKDLFIFCAAQDKNVAFDVGSTVARILNENSLCPIVIAKNVLVSMMFRAGFEEASKDIAADII